VFGHSIYIGITSIIINVVIAVVLTLVFKATRVPEGTDETLPHQYTADPEQGPAPTPAVVGAGAEG
jgi:solute:Na+ symporter, SSS family